MTDELIATFISGGCLGFVLGCLVTYAFIFDRRNAS